MDYLEKAQLYQKRACDLTMPDFVSAEAQKGILCALVAIAEQGKAELRPVEFRDGLQGRYLGLGARTSDPLALVELPDGTVVQTLATGMRFLDRQNEPADDEPDFPYCPQCGSHHDPALMNTTDCKTW